MKESLFEFIKQLGFVLFYYVGDIICRFVNGKDEFPKYYWIAAGLVLLYQIFKELKEIKNKLNKL